MKRLLSALVIVCLIFAGCKKDPCKDVTCFNNGTCLEGVCICTEGYEGSKCEQEVTPSKMFITSVRATDWPATDGGAGWDLDGGPDVYLMILDHTGSTVWESQDYYQDATPSVNFSVSPSLQIDPTSQYTFRLMDYDVTSPDDWMGGVVSVLYRPNEGFPSTVSISAGEFSFTAYVDYIW